MSSQFAANFAAICRDKFSLWWIPFYLLFAVFLILAQQRAL